MTQGLVGSWHTFYAKVGMTETPAIGVLGTAGPSGEAPSYHTVCRGSRARPS